MCRVVPIGFAVALLAAGFPAAASWPPFVLRPQVDYATGLSPWCVVTGDLNGDCFPDLAVANAGSNSVSVLLGRGDGTFQPRVDYPTSVLPRAVAIADVDRDGCLDLVVVNAGASTVSVLRGLGDGSFLPRIDYAAGAGSRSVVAGDLNGDGLLDLVTADADGNSISVLLAYPSGGFAPPQGSPTAAAPYFVVLGDLNHDGHLDAVVSNHTGGSVSPFLGRGDGTFGPRLDYLTAWNQWQVALADFDFDGHLDFVVVGAQDCYAAVQRGRGDGTFFPRSDFFPGCNGYGLAVADFNNDRLPDVAITYDSYVYGGTQYLGGFTLNPGAGNGYFGPRAAYTSGLTPISIAAADFDGNFSTDIAVANVTSRTVSVFLNAIPWGRPTSTVLVSSKNPAQLGEAVTLTATVSPDTARGIVEYRLDGAVVGRAEVTDGAALLVLNTLPVGVHSIIASHLVSADFGASTSDTLWQEVLQDAPTAVTADTPRFELQGIIPVPAEGVATVEFTTPDALPVSIEIFDVQGRRVWSRALGNLGAGGHRLDLPCKSMGPGFYYLRIEHKGARRFTRFAVVR
jgi:hypothetical protein